MFQLDVEQMRGFKSEYRSVLKETKRIWNTNRNMDRKEAVVESRNIQRITINLNRISDGRRPTNAINIYSLISDHDQRYNICIVWTRQMEAMIRDSGSQRKNWSFTCTDQGGSIGAMISMTVFHHQEPRKWYFRLGIQAFRCRWYFVLWYMM